MWPTDVDVSIANHAAVLTIMEIGRIDFMIRSGFFGLSRRNRWYFPLSRGYVPISMDDVEPDLVTTFVEKAARMGRGFALVFTMLLIAAVGFLAVVAHLESPPSNRRILPPWTPQR